MRQSRGTGLDLAQVMVIKLAPDMAGKRRPTPRKVVENFFHALTRRQFNSS